MYNIKNSIDPKKVSDKWLLKTYFGLDNPSHRYRFKSVFNPSEKTASMYFFTKDEGIYYKCFSTGKGGTLKSLIIELKELTYHSFYLMVERDHVQPESIVKIDLNEVSEIKFNYSVQHIDFRNWTKKDADYWLPYHISSKILEQHKVYPIARIYIDKIDIDTGIIVDTIKLFKEKMYGFFDDHNKLFKIYLPENKPKFISIFSCIQGDISNRYSNLMITSSLKDIMCMRALGISNIQMIAPPSETEVFDKSMIDFLKTSFERVITLFDNDTTGNKMSRLYKSLYDIDYAVVRGAKDPSDSVKYLGFENTFYTLVPSINNALYGS